MKLLKIDTEIEQNGYEFAKGFLKCVFDWLVVFILVAAFLNVIRNSFSISTDDSDKNGWNRSGMTLHTDYKTGVQYFSVKGCGIIRRSE